MGNNLNGLSQIVATAFLVDNALVDATGCNVVGFGCLDSQEAFIVSQVKIGFMAVYGHIAFSMLIRIQCSRVDVDIRVKLLDGYIVTSCLQQFTDGG